MKKNFLLLFAAVLAIGVSSFTVKKAITTYFVYDDSGVQNVRSSYNEVSSESARTGNTFLAWFRITDTNDNVITDTEFANGFEALDTVNDSSDTLDDDVEKTITSGAYTYQLEKKS